VSVEARNPLVLCLGFAVDPDLERDAEEAGQPSSREKSKGQDTLLER